MITAIQEILDIFQDFRMASTPIDEYDKGGKEVLADKLTRFVNAGIPMKFSMLGYPMKSTNIRDKVLGTKPDLGEEASLKNFARFNARIKEVYTPGVQFSIISDGYIFNDLLSTDDNIIAEYEEICKDMAAIAPVEWYDMTSFYSPSQSLSIMREKIMSQFGITGEELETRILMDPNVNALYKGMITFMRDELTMLTFESGNQLQKAAKKLAREMMFRNEAYSHLIEENFGDHIRLSMHPSTNNGTKYSFQLIQGPNYHHSPWHCAIAVDNNGDMETIHKKDAEEKGYQLVYKDQQPYYFTK